LSVIRIEENHPFIIVSEYRDTVIYAFHCIRVPDSHLEYERLAPAIEGNVHGAGGLLIVLKEDLERIAIACTGKRRDLRYGTGSVSDLSLDQKAF
jgi:hypothetical protein